MGVYGWRQNTDRNGSNFERRENKKKKIVYSRVNKLNKKIV